MIKVEFFSMVLGDQAQNQTHREQKPQNWKKQKQQRSKPLQREQNE